MHFRPEFELDILLISPTYRKERKQGAPWRELLPCFIYFFQDQLVNKGLLTESFHFLVFSSTSFLINDFSGVEGRRKELDVLFTGPLLLWNAELVC